jgi:hypothetical protein
MTDEENAHVIKLAMKWLMALALPVLGFVGKGGVDAYKKANPADDLLSRHVLTYFPWLKNAASQVDPILTLAFVVLVVLLLVLVFLAMRILNQAWKSTRPAALPEVRYAHPTVNAKKLLAKLAESSEDYKVIGGVIEIARHPFIVCDPVISGWDCMVGYGKAGGVRIEHDHGLPFAFDEALITGVEPPVGANNNKYSLVETPLDYLDASSSLCLKVRSTDYFTVKRFASLIHGEANTETRHDWGSIFPELQKVPNSLCLHFLVQLDDGSVLCMVRRDNSDYAQGLVSITAEEQFAEVDMHAGPEYAMNHWFRRALCEEIFPLRPTDSGMLERHWQEIKGYVKAMRVFSVFYEEEYANYSLFGYVRLGLDAGEYKEKFEDLARTHAAGRDKEGRYCLLSKENAINFALAGKGTISPIWGELTHAFGENESYRPHLTSRYRLLTFLLSVGAIGGHKPTARDENGSRRLIGALESELARTQEQCNALMFQLAQLQAEKS